MKIQQQDGCQAADTLGDLNQELTPVHCDWQADPFKELFSVPCFLFLSVLFIISNMSTHKRDKDPFTATIMKSLKDSKSLRTKEKRVGDNVGEDEVAEGVFGEPWDPFCPRGTRNLHLSGRGSPNLEEVVTKS